MAGYAGPVARGLGYGFGGWIRSRGGSDFGWVAYAPLSNSLGPTDAIGGLHPWARLIIWLALIAIWVSASVWLLRSPSDTREGHPTV
jgi:hypothetical protein